jgi:hypothetical protein
MVSDSPVPEAFSPSGPFTLLSEYHSIMMNEYEILSHNI